MIFREWWGLSTNALLLIYRRPVNGPEEGFAKVGQMSWVRSELNCKYNIFNFIYWQIFSYSWIKALAVKESDIIRSEEDPADGDQNNL